jgi:hypothetical protein
MLDWLRIEFHKLFWFVFYWVIMIYVWYVNSSWLCFLIYFLKFNFFILGFWDSKTTSLSGLYQFRVINLLFSSLTEKKGRIFHELTETWFCLLQNRVLYFTHKSNNLFSQCISKHSMTICLIDMLSTLRFEYKFKMFNSVVAIWFLQNKNHNMTQLI